MGPVLGEDGVSGSTERDLYILDKIEKCIPDAFRYTYFGIRGTDVFPLSREQAARDLIGIVERKVLPDYVIVTQVIVDEGADADSKK